MCEFKQTHKRSNDILFSYALNTYSERDFETVQNVFVYLITCDAFNKTLPLGILITSLQISNVFKFSLRVQHKCDKDTARKLPTMINMALLSELWSLLTAGNVLLLLLFLLLLHHLIEFYEFRGMPPGPRFYSIPFLGNLLSYYSRAGKSFRESTQRWVSSFS